MEHSYQPNPVIQADTIAPNANQWNIDKVRAQQVWEADGGNMGEGVVVATIDTGVRGTHEALKNNHREEHGWFDPADGDLYPTDNKGHGTHTMGTICGQTKEIGVAPGATWIACKGCGLEGCEETDLIECGNFMGCPTDVHGLNARCELAPNLVSNSWGGGQEDDFYDDIIAAWKALDIAPIFAIGNNGYYCETVNSPGDSIDAIGVGSSAYTEVISYFSSVGPTYHTHRIKPDIVAPGSDVTSSYSTADNAYSQMSGTSMACPHVAGIAALAYGKNPNLTYDQIRQYLIDGAQHTVKSTGANCGGISEYEYPNNHVGYGRADALATFNAIQ